jgi:hypothetical protein
LLEGTRDLAEWRIVVAQNFKVKLYQQLGQVVAIFVRTVSFGAFGHGEVDVVEDDGDAASGVVHFVVVRVGGGGQVVVCGFRFFRNYEVWPVKQIVKVILKGHGGKERQ